MHARVEPRVQVSALASDLGNLFESAVRPEDLVLIDVFVFSQLANKPFKVDGPHRQIKSKVVRMRVHESLVVGDYDLLSDTVQQLGTMVGRVHIS